MKRIRLIIATISTLLMFFVVGDKNVQAAQKTIQTIHYDGVKNNTYLSYDKNGKNLVGKKNLIKTNTNMRYYGTPSFIKGQKYVCFYIGKGRYIPLDSVGKVDGKNTFRLLKNSYIYNARGRRKGKLSYKYPVHFVGNLKKTSQDKKYFVLKEKLNSKGFTISTEKYYLTYKKIKNSYYYSLGKDRYINVRNVAAINGLQNYSNGEKVTVVAPGKQKVPVYIENNAEDEKVGKWLSGPVKTKDGITYRVLVDGRIIRVGVDDMILGENIPSGTTITVNAKTFGPQYKYQIKGTHTFINSTNVKRTKTKVSNYLPYYVNLDKLNN